MTHEETTPRGIVNEGKKEDEPEEEIPDLGTYTEEPTGQTIQTNSHAPKPKKMNDVYIKIHNASETMHSNLANSQQHQVEETSTYWC
jgi:hypothetical protein